MPNGRWSPDLITGNARIDAEHRELFAMAASMVADPKRSDTLKVGLAMLEYFESHAAEHFLAEEEQMSCCGYPGLLEHRAEHGRLVEYVANMRREVSSGGTDAEVLAIANRLLCNWLVRHMTTHDQSLASYLRDHPHPPAPAEPPRLDARPLR
ncbi:MAG: hemerythrin family protein [Deltaproteobacteria bacterium]|nr:hemerythrin family protein [Deltaproteobacteria bacterium]